MSIERRVERLEEKIQAGNKGRSVLLVIGDGDGKNCRTPRIGNNVGAFLAICDKCEHLSRCQKTEGGSNEHHGQN